MKIVVALDSFKGSLTAVQACDMVAHAIRSAVPGVEVVTKPMADGGEGTASVLMAAAGGQWIRRMVTGPLPDMEVEAGFVWMPDSNTALVEMATASGLPLLRPEQRNPLKTTTYGTGQLIRMAVDHGAKHILLAIGGSATVDGGVGAAMALGWKFLTKEKREIDFGGDQLRNVDRIVAPPDPLDATVEVLCDVDNPLCGEHGAARVYGPQKGATPEMVEQLDAGLTRLARVVKEQLGRDIACLPGAGAAGGLAAGAVAFMNARLVPGIDAIMSQTRLAEAVSGADWVVTGEGSFDEQSLHGKVVSGVMRVARAAGAKAAVCAGQVRLEPGTYRQAGIEAAVACMERGMELDYALAHSAELLDCAARRFARDYLCPQRRDAAG
ncbi:MAG: glycerate kinase [Planctomycetes bacterium]|nr:glycerate kinase [Planctomycetota bacterium]